MRLSIAALLFLLATVAVIAFAAGHTIAAIQWRAPAIYAEDREWLRADTEKQLDISIDHLAEARAKCQPPLAPVKWESH